MKNRFAGPCRECGLDVPVGAGTYEKNPAGGKGFNRHRQCDVTARLGREPSSILSEAQRARLAPPSPVGAFVNRYLAALNAAEVAPNGDDFNLLVDGIQAILAGQPEPCLKITPEGR